MTFYVGQKVVCVDDAWLGIDGGCPPGPAPVCGNVYEIAEVRHEGPNTFLVLAEFGVTPDWFAPAFRPAVQPKTDISVFEEIRDRAVKGEPVDA